jgi:hypothetical protein
MTSIPKHASKLAAAFAALTLLAPAPALAWGVQGHQVIAALARAYLSDGAKARIDALLATDKDALTPGDMLARAPWADAWRQEHKETTEWHFVDIEIDEPVDLPKACFNRPASLVPASKGPEKDCILGRLSAFEKEAADPTLPDAERVFALKYVLHLVGDIHQPMHASDHLDRGGNCIGLDLGDGRPTNLHTYWDSIVLRSLAPTNGEIAGLLKSKITPAQRQAWSAGTPDSWALESFEIAKTNVYGPLPVRPICDDGKPAITLPAGYKDQASAAIETQLEKAGVRLAWLLEKEFGDKPKGRKR